MDTLKTDLFENAVKCDEENLKHNTPIDTPTETDVEVDYDNCDNYDNCDDYDDGDYDDEDYEYYDFGDVEEEKFTERDIEYHQQIKDTTQINKAHQRLGEISKKLDDVYDNYTTEYDEWKNKYAILCEELSKIEIDDAIEKKKLKLCDIPVIQITMYEINEKIVKYDDILQEKQQHDIMIADELAKLREDDTHSMYSGDHIPNYMSPFSESNVNTNPHFGYEFYGIRNPRDERGGRRKRFNMNHDINN